MKKIYLTPERLNFKQSFLKLIAELILPVSKETFKKSSGCHLLFLLLIVFTAGPNVNAQVNITKPNLSISACSGFPSSYSALGNIVIAESTQSDFSSTGGSSVTLVLTAPTNFEFQAGTGSVSYAGFKNISSASISVTATTVTVTYAVIGTNKTDTMTISNLQVRAINTSSTGDVTRTSTSSGTINGITTGTTFTSTLTSTGASAPSQATGFTTGTLTSSTFPVSFSGSASGYLVVLSTSSTPPSQPVNGTTYTSANIATLGAGLTFIQSSSATSASATSLTGNTRYYYYIYAYNTCGSSIIYNTSGALIGNATTCPAVPNSVTTAGVTSSAFTLNWTAPTGGTASAITYTVQVTTDAGYTVNIAGSPFSIAAPTTTQNITGLTGSTTYYYRILANNGCSSSYVTGTVTTSTLTCVAPLLQANSISFSGITSTTIPGSFLSVADGSLVICSTSPIPPTQPTNGVIYSAANIATLGAGLTFIQSSNALSFTASGLSGNTRYYFFIYNYNNAFCSGGPAYNTSGPLTGTRITCPAVPNSVTTSGITSTAFALNWSAPTGGSASAITYTIQVTTDAGYTANITGSPFSIVAPTTTLNITGLSSSTTYYYRILASNTTCSSSYVTGNITTLMNPCTAPASQASGLTFGTITSSSIPATFTGVADNYLVIYSTSATLPTQPVNGTTYSAANVATLGTGLTFLQSNSATTLTASSLTANTAYYFFIYSYNNVSCTGGPVYNTAGPLTGNAVTCPNAPTSVVTSGITQNEFNLDWVAPTGGSASAISYTVQITTDAAFTSDVLDSPYTIVDPTTSLNVTDLNGNSTYYYRIMASNGCNSSYVTGSITTLNLPCDEPNQATVFNNGAITSTTYPASFLGSADGFLVIRSTSATPPTQPTNGTTYSAANIATLGAGLTFIQSGASYNIASIGLAGNTKYYYYVFAYTTATYCTGGPVYAIGGPLTGNGTTCPVAPTATAASITTSSFALNWASPTGGGASAITYTIQITTNAGFTNNIPGSPFTVVDPTTTLNVSGLTVGTTYYYRIMASNGCSSSYKTGSVTTSISNDECATAIALTVNTSATCVTSTAGTTIGATQSAGIACSGASNDDDVWYKFTATATSHIVTITTSSLNNPVFQFFYGSCAAASLCVNYNSAVTGTEANTFTGLTVGTTYYIRVFSYGLGATFQGDFNICVTTAVPPVNNDCSGAIALTVNTTTTCITSTIATTAYATQSQAGCAGNADDDVWFKFTAIATSETITVTPITINDVVLQSFSGACGSLSSLGCKDITGGSAIETTTLTGLTVGSVYYVRVYSFGNSANVGTFSICVTTPCSTGNGTGSSTTYCPNIVVGAYGMNGADPTPIACYSAASCTNIEAVYPDFNQSTSYTVNPVPYAPPYQYNCLANPISVNVDDIWSPLITLPFNFCFYGNSYNKVLIGSNGVITFDTTTYSPGGYSGWSFTNDLPSTSLFKNSIFGVYHDIDPSKGGQVGYELITLSSGCRALVAAWSDIPMYSTACNSSLYTGMIVLYENSNIIDVFVKEKNACSTWNSGNAVIGIQDATCSQAVVAPNRNSNDADWTVTYEGWRFAPSGASVASVKWFEGTTASGPVIGTTSALTVCPTTTTTYTAEVTYSFCNGVTSKYTDQTTVSKSSGKTWTGAIDTSWSNAGNWSPSGVPTNADCITIPNVTNKPVIDGDTYNANCYNLTLSPGTTLSTESSTSLTVKDFVKVNTGATFNVKNGSSLIQVNDTATNTGYINMDRTAYVKGYDYVYWSNPVRSFNSGNISPTTPAGYIFKWNPTISNGNGGQGNWVSGTETMSIGKGYIVLTPDTFSFTTPQPFTATFSGIPNNGIKKPVISRGSYTGANYTGTNGATITNLDDNWNLIGNPYPSAIDALSFLTLNTNINGNIRLWTHGTSPSSSASNPFYGSFALNYTVNDYVSFNGTGSTPPGFNGKIAAGQGFFVIMNDGTTSSSTVTFKNSLRSSAYNNSQFYKHSLTTNSASDEGRVWLSVVDSNNTAATTLVGYVADASYGYDRLYDASHKVSSTLSIYSWVNDKTVIINGRPTPFDDNDYVNIGTSVPSDGSYKIGINQVDGLFNQATQDIFLEDTELNVIHNLRTEPYIFNGIAGDYPNRFILRYKNTSLGNHEFESSSTYAYISNQVMHIKTDKTIKEIYLYDVAGKLIKTIKPDTESDKYQEEFPYQNGVYLLNIIKTDGSKASTKLLR